MAEKAVVTIKDVAALAGVSVSTVSRYLANPESVRAYAAYSVRNAVRELNYKPNTFAQSLRRGQSNIIGVVTPSAGYYFGESYKAISDFFYEKGYVAYLCSSDNDPEKERFFIESLRNQKAAGLVVISSGLNTEYLQQVAREYSRMIMLDRAEAVGCDIVAENHMENAYLLTRRMLRAAKPEAPVILLFGAERSVSTQEALRGAQRAIEECALSPECCRTVFNSYQASVMAQAADWMSSCVARGERPLVLAFGPNCLEDAVLAMGRRELSARDDVLIGGFALPNTMERLGFSFPCVIQNPEYSGIRAAETLYRRVAGQAEAEAPAVITVDVKMYLE